MPGVSPVTGFLTESKPILGQNRCRIQTSFAPTPEGRWIYPVGPPPKNVQNPISGLPIVQGAPDLPSLGLIVGIARPQ